MSGINSDCETGVRHHGQESDKTEGCQLRPEGFHEATEDDGCEQARDERALVKGKCPKESARATPEEDSVRQPKGRSQQDSSEGGGQPLAQESPIRRGSQIQKRGSQIERGSQI